MEGERRKRKFDKVDESEDEEENEKMNKFFALIRIAKEMREQIQKPPAVTRVWNPAFQAEDFIDPRHNRIAIGSSKTVVDTESEIGVANREEMEKIVEKEEEEEEDNEKEGKGLLDLNLSLW